MQIGVVGLDIAKQVFPVHAADVEGKPVAQLKLRRAQVLDYFRALPPCLVGMKETCTPKHNIRPASSRSADLEASLGEIDRQNMDVGHALLLRTRPDGARWHLTMPDGGGIHPISSPRLRSPPPEVVGCDEVGGSNPAPGAVTPAFHPADARVLG